MLNTRLVFGPLIALLLLALPLPAQVWVKVASEAAGNTVTIPAGVSWRFGTAASSSFCDTVKTTAATTVPVSSSITCTISGVLTPAPSVGAELDVQAQTTAITLQTVINGAKSSVTIGALPAPPAPPSTSPTAVSTFPAVCTVYSDGTFKCVPNGPITVVK